MDPITGQVRTLYDRFPYPDESDQVRADAFLELLLSYVERPRREPPLYVLDAGCGPGKRGNRLELERSVGVRPTAVRGCVRGDVVHAQYVDARLAEVQRHPDRE